MICVSYTSRNKLNIYIIFKNKAFSIVLAQFILILNSFTQNNTNTPTQNKQQKNVVRASSEQADALDQKFCKSFISCYDFSVLGKYAHEYHPTLLSYSHESIRDLEKTLAQEFSPDSKRLLIMGYEQHALPNFFPIIEDFKGDSISDEFSENNLSDWSQKIHNHFGIMSAFLFRALALTNNESCVFRSIVVDGFEQVFEPCLRHFHKYSFGEYFKIINKYEQNLEPLFRQKNTNKVLKKLCKFWEELYAYPSKDSHSNVVITGDILFNIENIKQIIESNLDIQRFYLGPDLTYPIETKKNCSQKATRNAQKFLQIFTEELKPINKLTTAYIFKSFVDGVGKSTLLGNIKNYIKFNLDFQQYETTDNSSTIDFDIFPFSDNVFIVDLPAQMSHSTFKPDGMVFVPLSAIKISQQEENFLHLFFQKNLTKCDEDYAQLSEKVHEIISSDGLFAKSFYNYDKPELLWMRNIILLKKEIVNNWRFFKHNNKVYLGRLSDDDRTEIKILRKITVAGSEGLKNAEPTQMLFYDGITIPTAYDIFLQSLCLALKERGVKKIVFVDFLSMYSRSSRETVRLNYLLQQAATIDPDFALHNTLYDNYICDTHLLSRLDKKRNQQNIIKNITTETVLRCYLHRLLETGLCNTAYNISDQEISQKAKTFFANNKDFIKNNIEPIVQKKFSQEKNILMSRYGSKKNYCNLFQIDWKRIQNISEYLQFFFTKKIDAPIFEKYFEAFPNIVDPEKIDSDSTLMGNNNEKLVILADITKDYRNKLNIQTLMSVLRQSWYRLIFNLLNAHPSDNGLCLEAPLFWDNFIVVKPGINGKIYFLQRKQNRIPISLAEPKLYTKPFSFANHKHTHTEIFGFAQPNTNNQFYTHQSLETIVAFTILDYFDQCNNEQIEVMPIAQLFQNIQPYICGWHKHLHKKISQTTNNRNPNQRLKPGAIKILPKEYHISITWLARLFATLETFVRDINATILVKPTKKDFMAAVALFQSMILPEYFGLFMDSPLPDNIINEPIFSKWLDEDDETNQA